MTWIGNRYVYFKELLLPETLFCNLMRMRHRLRHGFKALTSGSAHANQAFHPSEVILEVQYSHLTNAVSIGQKMRLNASILYK